MRTRLCRCYSTLGFLSFLLTAAALIIGFSAAPAAAQTCTQDEYNSFNGTHKTLSCTANDVSVAAVQGVTVIKGGSGSSCFAGSTFDFIADFEIKTTSTKTRSNIGIFFGTSPGATQALTGTCSQSILSPTHPCVGNSNFTCGDANYEELDGPINGEKAATSTTAGGCGDTTSGDFTSTFGAGTQAAELEVDGLTCPTNPVTCPPGTPTPPGITTCVPLPVCTSWWEPTSTMPTCTITPTAFLWQPQAVPGTSSKCNCGTLFIPVQPVKPSATVAKSCTGGGTTNGTVCNLGPGDTTPAPTVTYTATIKNTSSFGGVVIDQICDSVYGTVFRSGTFTGTGCATAGTVTNTTCPPSPNDITTTGSCTFTVSQAESKTITDFLTIDGHTDVPGVSTAFPTATSGTVTVNTTESPSTATTTKGLGMPHVPFACDRVRYTVTVSNTSSADEVLTLFQVGLPGSMGYVTALHDSIYSDITTLHGPDDVTGSVLGTTCGVSGASGLGTLSGVAGAGAFPVTLTQKGTPTSSYTCEFDGEFCGNVTAGAQEYGAGNGTCNTTAGTPGVGTCTAGVLEPGLTTCTSSSQCDLTCTGFSQSDTVMANLTGDEGEAVSQTPQQFNVTICTQGFGVQTAH